jgi:hypothetical protein
MKSSVQLRFSLVFQGCAMAYAVSRQSPTAKNRVQSQTTSCEIFGGQGGTGTGFLRVLRFSSCQHHSINASYPSSSKCCSYLKGKLAKPAILLKNDAVSEIEEHWKEKYFTLLRCVIPVVLLIQHKPCIYFKYTFRQNTTNSMWGGITV